MPNEPADNPAPHPDDERVVIRIKLPRDLIKRVDHVALDLDVDRARAIEEMLTDFLPRFEARVRRARRDGSL